MSEAIVLHLGDATSYSGQAARILAEGHDARACDSFEAIETALRDGSAHQAVVPLRNSVIGKIAGAERWEGGWVRTRDALALPIDHCLAGHGAIGDVEQVISHRAALAQCDAAITQNGWNREEADSTSAAANRIAMDKDPTRAAICSHACAEAHGLSILSNDIADEEGNETLFALIEVVGVD